MPNLPNSINYELNQVSHIHNKFEIGDISLSFYFWKLSVLRFYKKLSISDCHKRPLSFSKYPTIINGRHVNFLILHSNMHYIMIQWVQLFHINLMNVSNK